MTNLSKLLEENDNNYFKLLVLIGDEISETEKLNEIEIYLKTDGWEIYDVEDVVMDLIEKMDEEDIEFTLGDEIKFWIKSTGSKIYLKNANILYSKDLGSPKPFYTFNYLMRDTKQAVLVMDGKLRGNNKIIYSSPDKDDFAETDISTVVYEEIKNIKVK